MSTVAGRRGITTTTRTPTRRRLSWSDWRGYEAVVAHTKTVADGVVLGDRSVTTSNYFRGMYGDKLTASTTKTETVATIEVGARAGSQSARRAAGRGLDGERLGTRLKRVYYTYFQDKTIDVAEVAGSPAATPG
jgi:hypothetical protein